MATMRAGTKGPVRVPAAAINRQASLSAGAIAKIDEAATDDLTTVTIPNQPNRSADDRDSLNPQ